MTKKEETKQHVKEEVMKIKCPGCGSEKLDLPKHIEKKDGGIFIKDTNIQLHTLPNPAYICSKCSREISSDEVFKFLEANAAQLALK